jgi:drug/metabolite transporter (DMT)-like permease
MNLNKYLTPIFLIIPVTWAGSFIAGKYVVQSIEPLESVFFRFFFSAIVMLPFLLIWRRNTRPVLFEPKFIKHIFLVVLTSGIGYHLPFFAALKYTSPTNTALIIALNPFFTAIVEKFLNKEKRSKRFYLGFIMAFTGAIWVIISRGKSGFELPGKGELLCLIASLFWSVYTILSKYTKEEKWDSYWIGAYNYLLTALIIIPFTFNILSIEYWQNISVIAWSGIWYMAIFPTAIGYTLFYIGIQKRGPAWAAAFIYLVPSMTANLDLIFFGAEFTFSMVLGTTFVVIGLFTGNLSQQQFEKVKILFKKINISNIR